MVLNIFSLNFYTSVHPCDRASNGGCSQVCEKDGDNAKCGCDDGYELLDDKVTCKKSKSRAFIYSTVIRYL